MAINVISTGGGGGGATSADVTVTSDKVLNGYTTVMSDSGDEVVQGTMPEWQDDFLREESVCFKAAVPFSLTTEVVVSEWRTLDAEKIWDGTIYYSIDNANWIEWSGLTAIAAGQNAVDNNYYLYLKGSNNTYISRVASNDDWEPGFSFTIADGNYVEGYGNMENLLDSNTVCFGEHPAMGDYCFAQLFEKAKLSRAPELGSITLTQSCYNSMFSYTSVTNIPVLPAEEVPEKAYAYMFCFSNVVALSTQIHGKVFGREAMNSMFWDCNQLATATTTFEFTTLGQRAASYMFCGCTSLSVAPGFIVESLDSYEALSGCFQQCSAVVTANDIIISQINGDSSFQNMFNGCTSLTTMPNITIPNTIPKAGLYGLFLNMFDSCSSLVTIKDITLSTLGERTCMQMFRDCSSIVTPPRIFAKDITGEEACAQMFSGCTALTTVPVIHTTTLTTDCFMQMFAGCTALKVSETKEGEYQFPWRIPVVGTATEGVDFSYEMFSETGGTFTGDPVENTTYYLAVESPKQSINITYLANDGSGTTSVVTTTSDTPYTIPGTIVTPREGYQFKCWVKFNPIVHEDNTADILAGDTLNETTHTLTIGSGKYIINGSAHSVVQTTIIGSQLDTDVRYYQGDSVAFTESLSLATLWRYPHTISFDANGGSGTMPDIYTTSSDDTLVLPACTFIPASADKVFAGWLINNIGDIHQPGEVIEFLDDSKLYAFWKTKVTVSFDAGRGSGTMPDDYGYLNEAYTLPGSTFTPPGADSFIGWLIDGASYGAGQKIVLTVPITAVAQYASGYTITFYANGGSGTMAPQTALPGSVVKETVPNEGDSGTLYFDTTTSVETVKAAIDTIIGWQQLDSDADYLLAFPDDQSMLLDIMTYDGVNVILDMLTYTYYWFSEDIEGMSAGWQFPATQLYKVCANKTLMPDVEGVPIGAEHEKLSDFFFKGTVINGYTVPASTFVSPDTRECVAWAVGSAASTDFVKPGESTLVTENKDLYAVWAHSLVIPCADGEEYPQITIHYQENGCIWRELAALSYSNVSTLMNYYVIVGVGLNILYDTTEETAVTPDSVLDITHSYYYWHSGG